MKNLKRVITAFLLLITLTSLAQNKVDRSDWDESKRFFKEFQKDVLYNAYIIDISEEGDWFIDGVKEKFSLEPTFDSLIVVTSPSRRKFLFKYKFTKLEEDEEGYKIKYYYNKNKALVFMEIETPEGEKMKRVVSYEKRITFEYH